MPAWCIAEGVFDELCAVHGQNDVSYATFTRSLKPDVTLIYDAQKLGRPCSATASKMVEKVCDVADARLTAHQLATRVGISVASVFRILKHSLKMRRISARWIPHLLSDKQKRV